MSDGVCVMYENFELMGNFIKNVSVFKIKKKKKIGEKYRKQFLLYWHFLLKKYFVSQLFPNT